MIEPTQTAFEQRGFFICLHALPYSRRISSANLETRKMMATPNSAKSRINVDLIAVAIALTLAALIRFNVIPAVSF